MTVVSRGRTGASGDGANVACSPGEVPSKGSPAATDERCVLDEHIGGPGRQAAGLPAISGANAWISPQPGPSSETDGNRNRRTGGLRDRIYLLN